MRVQTFLIFLVENPALALYLKFADRQRFIRNQEEF